MRRIALLSALVSVSSPILASEIHFGISSTIGNLETIDTLEVNTSAAPIINWYSGTPSGRPRFTVSTQDVSANSFTLLFTWDVEYTFTASSYLGIIDPLGTADAGLTDFTGGALAPSVTSPVFVVSGQEIFFDLSDYASPQNGFTVTVYQTPTSGAPIPEPAILALTGIGLIGLTAMRRRH